MSSAAPKVIYVAGFARCGSTLLGSMLGQLDGFVNVGEIHMIWSRGVGDDRSCGCGLPFSECEVWPSVMARLANENGALNAGLLAEQGRDLSRTRRLPLVMLDRLRRRAVSSVPNYIEHTRRLYEAIADVTDARVVVDTSKVPMYGYALREAGLDVSVVHLVRDPRAVALSRLVRKPHADTRAQMGGKSVVDSALMWNVVNGAVERILGSHDYLRIGYRGLVEDPASAIADIAALAGEPDATGLSISGDRVKLLPTHTVFGNPGRFDTGEIRLRLDDRWRAELSSRRRDVVEVLTASRRRRYADLI
jgi:hypothetical protein